MDGKRVILSSRASQSLLAYLALTAGTSHRREKLAGMFWPDVSDEKARTYLRHELWRIRKAIPAQELSPADNYLLADEFTLTFNPHSDYWLDVAILEKPEGDLQSLTSSLSLYQGELLPGFYDDWVVLERERLQTLFETKMERLVEKLVDAERWTAVQEQCERWLALGRASEPAYRALMLSYNARGDMAKVSATYQRCVEDLREQYDVEPSAETHALFNGLLKGAKVPQRIMPAQPSGTVTFLFTDIQGSTRLLDKLGEEYARSLAEHHYILRKAIQKWKGTEMDTQGDAFFVTFTRALDAVQCAVEAQHAFANHAWSQDEPIRVRMGLHTGEPLIASTGYVGMDVHRAARIGDAGHGGQVLLSQTTRELVVEDLPPGVTIKELGEHRLKDMKYPTMIYQLVIKDLQADFPPLKMKFSGTEAPTPGEPPFKGLQYFDQADSDLFFGRELLIAKLVDQLRETQFLSVIIGASGSGKSSLVRAGLIPALKKGATLLEGTQPSHDTTDWKIHIITPTAHPLEALATELTSDSDSVASAARLIDDLAQEPRSLALFLARARGSAKRHTVLLVDQFEELFTLCRDEFEREAFIDNLLNIVSSDPSNTTLIITLRADFYAHLAQYPELRDLVAKQQEYIGPMNPEELRRAIEEPARRGHWEFEPGLVDLILRDVGDEPGALPLLSHALLETWKRRAGHTLTLKGYADAGGVHGAIAHTAESVYQNFSPEEQAIARDIFLRLTELGEGTEDTRRRASFEELMSHTENTDEVRKVLNRLADARLITLGEDTVEVAHEALIREWPALREWLNQDREGLRLHRHLTEAAYEWELLGRDPGALYRGAHLVQAREWAALHPNALNVGEREYLAASINQEHKEEQEREEQRQREFAAAKELAETQSRAASRLRIRNRVITIVGSFAVILALLAGLFGVQAETNFNKAEAQRLALEANRLFSAGGSPEQIALLSLRSMNTQYTPEGDSALAAAGRLNYHRQLFVGPSDGVFPVAFSPDGNYVLAGGWDNVIYMWDVKTGNEIRQFIGHMDLVYSITFSPDGKYVLTGSWDKSARIWDLNTGKEIRQFTGHTDFVSAVAYSPSGKNVLTAGVDGTTRLWDAETGQELQKFMNLSGKNYSATLSPDGKFWLTGDTNAEVELWDIEANQVIRQFIGHTGFVSAVAFSPDGKFIITGSYDGTARLWNVETGEELQRFLGHTNNINSVTFLREGKVVLTGSDDGTARLWDVQTGQELQRFTSLTIVTGVAVSPDGKSVLTGSGDGTIRLWNSEPRYKFSPFDHNSGVSAVAFSPDGKFVLTGGSDGVAGLWNAKSGQKLFDLSGHGTTINYGVAFSPNGKYALTGSWDKTVRLWDVETGTELYALANLSGGVNSVAFSPDGKHIAADSDNGVEVWETETGQPVREFSGIERVWRVAFSADGKFVAAAANDGAALWDATTGHLLRQFSDGSGLNSVAFSPDGNFILTGGHNNTARLWNVETGQEIRPFIGHTDLIWTAVFSPDGRFIATASADGTARLWDTQTGEELRRFIGHTAGVENVAFSPNGEHLLTGSDDGTAMLWDVDYHTTMEYLCSVLLRDFTDDERAQYGITDITPTCPNK
jgi:WD40 repeat protein/class 3 adenylate cyclase